MSLVNCNGIEFRMDVNGNCVRDLGLIERKSELVWKI